MKTFQLFVIFIFFFAAHSAAYAKQKVKIVQPVIGMQGMVSSQEAIATEVGVNILKQGGNSVDAAVAVGFALAVTYPQAGNLGGGGFMMVYLADKKKTIALDYREMAPAKSGRDMFLDGEGNVDNMKARFSHLSSGVPGSVAGMVHALKNYGSMSLKQVIAPALDLADNGFVVSTHLHKSLKRASRRLVEIDSSNKAFYKGNGTVPEEGSKLVQKDLAWTLSQISKKGSDAFYKGSVAKKIAEDSQKHGGIITMDDLANYKVIEREPILGNYRGYTIASMPPPSSGGVHLVQILNILEGWDLNKYGLHSAKTINMIAESMKRAYSDRSW